MIGVFVNVIIAVLKCHDQSSLKKKWFILILLPYTCSSSKDVKTGSEIGYEPGGRNQRRCHGGVLLIELLTMAYSVTFLQYSGKISPGIVLPTMDWALPHQSLIFKIIYISAYSLILCKWFLNKGSVLPHHFRLCQVDINLYFMAAEVIYPKINGDIIIFLND